MFLLLPRVEVAAKGTLCEKIPEAGGDGKVSLKKKGISRKNTSHAIDKDEDNSNDEDWETSSAAAVGIVLRISLLLFFCSLLWLYAHCLATVIV